MPVLPAPATLPPTPEPTLVAQTIAPVPIADPTDVLPSTPDVEAPEPAEVPAPVSTEAPAGLPAATLPPLAIDPTGPPAADLTPEPTFVAQTIAPTEPPATPAPVTEAPVLPAADAPTAPAVPEVCPWIVLDCADCTGLCQACLPPSESNASLERQATAPPAVNVTLPATNATAALPLPTAEPSLPATAVPSVSVTAPATLNATGAPTSSDDSAALLIPDIPSITFAPTIAPPAVLLPTAEPSLPSTAVPSVNVTAPAALPTFNATEAPVSSSNSSAGLLIPDIPTITLAPTTEPTSVPPPTVEPSLPATNASLPEQLQNGKGKDDDDVDHLDAPSADGK